MASASTQDGNTIPVMAPKDAEGRLVPLDVKVMYSVRGIEYEVDTLLFECDTESHDASWTMRSFDFSSDMVYNLPLSSMYLYKPDSLKQLVEDLNRAWDASGKGCRYMPCHYDKDRGDHCNDCRLNSHGKMMCLDAMMADIVSRVNHLCGDAE